MVRGKAVAYRVTAWYSMFIMMMSFACGIRYHVACRGGRIGWLAHQPRFECARGGACGGRRDSCSSRMLEQVRVAVGGSVAVRGCSAGACEQVPHHESYHGSRVVVAAERSQA